MGDRRGAHGIHGTHGKGDERREPDKLSAKHAQPAPDFRGAGGGAIHRNRGYPGCDGTGAKESPAARPGPVWKRCVLTDSLDGRRYASVKGGERQPGRGRELHKVGIGGLGRGVRPCSQFWRGCGRDETADIFLNAGKHGFSGGAAHPESWQHRNPDKPQFAVCTGSQFIVADFRRPRMKNPVFKRV